MDGSGSHIHLTIGGKEVHSVAFNLVPQRWYYFCHSWETGNIPRWLLFINGDLVGQGEDTTDRPRLIPGGGTVIFGQQQPQFSGGFNFNHDRTTGFVASTGVEGEMTLMYFDSRHLRFRQGNRHGVVDILNTRINTGMQSLANPITSSCFDSPVGNIVAWGITEMKLVGGATEESARSTCGNF